MNERDYRMSFGTLNSNPISAPQNAYTQALKALQEKLKGVEELKKSIDNPSDNQIDQLKKHINDLQSENERLQYQLMKTNQENQMNIIQSQQIDVPQIERIQHLRDYQDKISDVIRKYEELKYEKQEIQKTNENLQRQLQIYQSNQQGFMNKTNNKHKKIENNNNIQDLKTKLDIKDQQLKIQEKKIEYLEIEKEQILQEFITYKTKYPPMKLHDYEKSIHQMKILLEEKDNQYTQNINEIERNKNIREEQMSRRIQDLIGKCNEYQQIIEQLTQDYKDLSLKYQQVKIKLDYQERQYKYINRKQSQGELKQSQYKNINNFDMSPPYTSARIEQSKLKQAIRECLKDMMNTQNYSPDRRSENRNQPQILSPISTSRQFEIETQLKELNEKYENLMIQAQKENDLNSKAVIRKQLLEIAGQIKETTKFEKS